MRLFTQYDEVPHLRVPDLGESLTRQSFKDECDVNRILRRAQLQGVVSPGDLHGGTAMYADVSEVGDYQEALAVVAKAEEAFAALPARVRERFKNDPAQLLAFLADPKNVEEAIELGLAKRREGAEASKAKDKPPVPPEPGSAPTGAPGASGAPLIKGT